MSRFHHSTDTGPKRRNFKPLSWWLLCWTVLLGAACGSWDATEVDLIISGITAQQQSLQITTTLNGQPIGHWADQILPANPSATMKYGLQFRRETVGILTVTVQATAQDPCQVGSNTQSVTLAGQPKTSLNIVLTTASCTAQCNNSSTPAGFCWESPLPQGNPLNRIWVFSNLEVWTVGNRGTFLRTNDAGQTWQQVATGVPDIHNYNLYGIWASGPMDIWVAGAESPTEQNGIVLHWDGQQWEAAPEPNNALYRIWGVSATGASATDVWAVGYDHANSQSGIVHFSGWDGSGGTSEPHPLVDATLYSIHGSSKNDIWAVGDKGTVMYRGMTGTWSQVTSGVSYPLKDVWATGSTGEWAVGGDGPNTPNILQCTQAGSCMDVPSMANYQLRQIQGIWGDASGELWAVGLSGYDSGGYVAHVLHYSKDAKGAWGWTAGVSTEPTPQSGFQVTGLLGISGTDRGNLWTVGQGGTVLRVDPDGLTWSPPVLGAQGNLSNNSVDGHSISASQDGNNVWALEGDGRFTRHWDGTKWSRDPTGANTDSLGHGNAIWVSPAGTAWALVYNQILQYQNGAWMSVYANGAMQSLQAIYGINDSDIRVVGTSGTILHYTTETNNWEPETVPGVDLSSVNLNAVWSMAQDAWIVGPGGTVLHKSGAVDWQPVPLPAAIKTASFTNVFGANTDEVWFAGNPTARWTSTNGWDIGDGTNPKYTGTWTNSSYAIWGIDPKHLWSVGLNGGIQQWNGSVWQAIDSGTTNDLFSISGASSGKFWIAGVSGTILSYRP